MQPMATTYPNKSRVMELLTPDGNTLTPAGEKLAAWLQVHAPQSGGLMATYTALVLQQQAFTPAGWMLAYPNDAMQMWDKWTQAAADQAETQAAQATESAPPPHTVKTVPLVENQQLTPDGAALTAWLDENAAAEFDAESDETTETALFHYISMKKANNISAAAYLERYPEHAATLQEAYQRRGTRPTATQPTTQTESEHKPMTTVQLIEGYKLTTQGETLIKFLSGHIVNTHAGLSYHQEVQRQRITRPADWMRQNPSAARALWEAYTAYIKQTLSGIGENQQFAEDLKASIGKPPALVKGRDLTPDGKALAAWAERVNPQTIAGLRYQSYTHNGTTPAEFMRIFESSARQLWDDMCKDVSARAEQLAHEAVATARAAGLTG